MQTKELSLYHLIRPANVPNPSVLILLHGYGSNEEDLFSFASELPLDLCILSVRAPHTLQPFGYAWYAIHFDAQDGKWSDDAQAIASRDQIVQFIDEACAAYNLDADKVNLLGFSQGCILSFAVALSYPDKIQNVIGLSGYLNQRILKENYQQNQFDHLGIYSSHGIVDQVIPVEWARKTQPFLQGLEIENFYEEFPVGHGVAPQNFFSFKNWLVKKLKKQKKKF
ncbi:MAG: alpha/beta fold hydrolase [Flavobacteriaceae bacterium]|nr:alpha/beta fold hydrolase [Flavobacteriaceae bacterium]